MSFLFLHNSLDALTPRPSVVNDARTRTDATLGRITAPRRRARMMTMLTSVACPIRISISFLLTTGCSVVSCMVWRPASFLATSCSVVCCLMLRLCRFSWRAVPSPRFAVRTSTLFCLIKLVTVHMRWYHQCLDSAWCYNSQDKNK